MERVCDLGTVQIYIGVPQPVLTMAEWHARQVQVRKASLATERAKEAERNAYAASVLRKHNATAQVSERFVVDEVRLTAVGLTFEAISTEIADYLSRYPNDGYRTRFHEPEELGGLWTAQGNRNREENWV